MHYVVLLLAMGGAVTVLLTLVSAGLRSVATWTMLRPETALAIPAWAAAMIGVNLEHYWLDHRIWRTRKRAAATRAGRCGGCRAGQLRAPSECLQKAQQRGALLVGGVAVRGDGIARLAAVGGDRVVERGRPTVVQVERPEA